MSVGVLAALCVSVRAVRAVTVVLADRLVLHLLDRGRIGIVVLLAAGGSRSRDDLLRVPLYDHELGNRAGALLITVTDRAEKPLHV